MSGLNSFVKTGERHEDMAGIPNVKVTHGLNEHQVALHSNAGFGKLKGDGEDLRTAGVKNCPEGFLVQGISCTQERAEFKEASMIAQGSAAVAEVKEEVDKLSEKVSSLQAAADSGVKVDAKDILYVTEMLMRQLLQLDGIEAEGEAKVQRKMEVHRIQSFVETMDYLKSRNLDPFCKVDGDHVSLTTKWETFEPDWGNATIPPSLAASSSPNTQAQPSPTPNQTLEHTPTITSSSPSAEISSISSQIQSSTHKPVKLAASTMASSFIPSPVLSSPSSFNNIQSSNPVPVQLFAPIPSSAKVTEEWVQFD
ncbi:BAG family molecular chaperone regulator 4-like [Andrographis paniculata]|uniref:BAG family molecular chaperone regulator 4-like n=1 Tax=Andrographis paniculata TaxID=175694 RepID=UPI0021E6F4A5|nr:BAG family molecular chaperone regulator 4-like [Andrographis paniculata]